MQKKMFIKQTDATSKSGIAGCEVICISAKSGGMMEVCVAKDSELAGPVKVAQSDVEFRTVGNPIGSLQMADEMILWLDRTK